MTTYIITYIAIGIILTLISAACAGATGQDVKLFGAIRCILIWPFFLAAFIGFMLAQLFAKE